ncbi:P-loop containing nucleoside triphosphate hydrolase protein [Peniophora sp. CONT]|nr:P-loop containing nucleoside triphosphate hydrolase protein [Peniophora sp. CONT]
MSFFPPLRRLSTNLSRTVAGQILDSHAKNAHLARAIATKSGEHASSLEHIGVPSTLAHAVRTVYPHIQRPYAYQAQLVPAITRGANVTLKGRTGSGKSFSLALAALSQAWHSLPEIGSRVSTLILVPHRDLAAQYFAWMTSIVTAAQGARVQGSFPNALAPEQIFLLARGYSDDLTVLHGQVFPRILISTPSALVSALGHSPTPESVTGLFSTVVVDELDDQLDYIPRADTSKTLNRLIKAKMKRHPRPTKEILDALSAPNRVSQTLSHRAMRGEGSASPQLVLASATYREGLVDFVQGQQYFDESRELVRIKVHPGEIDHRDPNATENKTSVRERDTSGQVLHHALVVTSDGQVRNHTKASKRYDSDRARGALPVLGRTVTESPSGTPGTAHEAPTAEAILAKAEEGKHDTQSEDDTPEELVQKYMNTDSPFNQRAMEVVAEVFAYEVKLLSLLILPSEASVRRAIWELRQLGVNAMGLNLKDNPHVLRSDASAEQPTLLVATDATTRGLDIWNLSHVFIYGVPDGHRSADQYLHWAGRVGRLAGRERGLHPSRVITIVIERPRPSAAEPKSRIEGLSPRTSKDEERALERIFDKLHIRPYVYSPYEAGGSSQDRKRTDSSKASVRRSRPATSPS